MFINVGAVMRCRYRRGSQRRRGCTKNVKRIVEKYQARSWVIPVQIESSQLELFLGCCLGNSW